MLAASLISRELQNFQNYKIQTLGNNNSPLNTTDFRNSNRSPHPLVGRPGGRPIPSTGRPVGRPVGRPSAQQRVGYFQSVDRAVDRASCLCTLCTSVDRAGQPICYCGRSTGPVDRSPATAAVDLFCCCPFLRLSSTIPRRSSSTSSAITSLFPTLQFI